MDLSDLAIALAAAIGAAVPLGLTLWALLDAARRPQWAWALAERRQVIWLAGIVFGMFTVVGGVAVSAWYLTRVRHEVAAAEAGQLLAGLVLPARRGPYRCRKWSPRARTRARGSQYGPRRVGRTRPAKSCPTASTKRIPAW